MTTDVRPTTSNPPATARAMPARGGFTLVELMISIVLVLVIIIGVNEVFSLTSRTVGAGQALNAIQRDNRTTLQTLRDDFQALAMNDGPFFLIRSEARPAFRNVADRTGDVDGNPLTFDNGTGTESAVPRYILGPRTHRLDQIRFFARGLFQRQTGNDGTYAANMSSSEAFISYGHLNRPNRDASAYLEPGVLTDNDPASNPNNGYAAQWVLGRTAILMVQKQGGQVTDRSGHAQAFYNRPSNAPQRSVHPFQSDTPAEVSDNSPATGGWRLRSSRFDVVGTTIEEYRDILESALNSGSPFDWVTPVSNYRFNGNPEPIRPLDSAGTALAVPVFIAGCTQFVVEYAGDFVEQNDSDINPGAVSRSVPDNKIDFVHDPVAGARKVRWYGFPRDTNDDGVVDPAVDVVPLALLPGASRAAFERQVPARADRVEPDDVYTVAWGPDTRDEQKPSMIRVTITVDDPTPAAARIGAGQTFEYVFRLQ